MLWARLGGEQPAAVRRCFDSGLNGRFRREALPLGIFVCREAEEARGFQWWGIQGALQRGRSQTFGVSLQGGGSTLLAS